ncbi:hypothetical protein DMUE_3031 [Dictyocoela muelleri]|nr:hypothetical protein DMUE_3031 [Dictyocoela muelleri]
MMMKDMASVLNSFFCSVFRVEASGFERDTVYTGQVPLNDIVLTREAVVEQLEGLTSYKSIGPDGHHPRVFKETREQLADSLTHIFNLSMTSDELLKIVNFQERGPTIASNYRPISMMSIMCKTPELFIRVHFVDHLEDNGLIRDT